MPLALLSLHAAADELRRRPAPGEASLPPLARRLFAPLAALMTSFAMLTLAGAAAALGATAVGALVFAGVLWVRARKSRVGAALVPALMFVSVGAAALAVLSASLGLGDRTAIAARAEDTGAVLWLGHAGYLGAGLLAALFAALLIVLSISKDRGRAPSRGAPLLSAFVVYGALLSWFAPGFTAPAAAFLLAVLIGLSLSYVDLNSARKPSQS